MSAGRPPCHGSASAALSGDPVVRDLSDNFTSPGSEARTSGDFILNGSPFRFATNSTGSLTFANTGFSFAPVGQGNSSHSFGPFPVSNSPVGTAGTGMASIFGTGGQVIPTFPISTETMPTSPSFDSFMDSGFRCMFDEEAETVFGKISWAQAFSGFAPMQQAGARIFSRRFELRHYTTAYMKHFLSPEFDTTMFSPVVNLESSTQVAGLNSTFSSSASSPAVATAVSGPAQASTSVAPKAPPAQTDQIDQFEQIVPDARTSSSSLPFRNTLAQGSSPSVLEPVFSFSSLPDSDVQDPSIIVAVSGSIPASGSSSRLSTPLRSGSSSASSESTRGRSAFANLSPYPVFPEVSVAGPTAVSGVSGASAVSPFSSGPVSFFEFEQTRPAYYSHYPHQNFYGSYPFPGQVFPPGYSQYPPPPPVNHFMFSPYQAFSPFTPYQNFPYPSLPLTQSMTHPEHSFGEVPASIPAFSHSTPIQERRVQSTPQVGEVVHSPLLDHPAFRRFSPRTPAQGRNSAPVPCFGPREVPSPVSFSTRSDSSPKTTHLTLTTINALHKSLKADSPTSLLYFDGTGVDLQNRFLEWITLLSDEASSIDPSLPQYFHLVPYSPEREQQLTSSYEVDRFVYLCIKKFTCGVARDQVVATQEFSSGRIAILDMAQTYVQDDSGAAEAIERDIDEVSFSPAENPHGAILRLQKLVSMLTRVQHFRGKPAPDQNDICLKIIRKLPSGACYADLKRLEAFSPDSAELHDLFILRTTINITYDSFSENQLNSSANGSVRMIEEDPHLGLVSCDEDYGYYDEWMYDVHDQHPEDSILALYGKGGGKGKGLPIPGKRPFYQLSGKGRGTFGRGSSSSQYGPRKFGKGSFGKKGSKSGGKFGGKGYPAKGVMHKGMSKGRTPPCQICYSKRRREADAQNAQRKGSGAPWIMVQVEDIRHSLSDCPEMDPGMRSRLRQSGSAFQAVLEEDAAYPTAFDDYPSFVTDWNDDFVLASDGWGSHQDVYNYWSENPSNHGLVAAAREQGLVPKQLTWEPTMTAGTVKLAEIEDPGSDAGTGREIVEVQKKVRFA